MARVRVDAQRRGRSAEAIRAVAMARFAAVSVCRRRRSVYYIDAPVSAARYRYAQTAAAADVAAYTAMSEDAFADASAMFRQR